MNAVVIKATLPAAMDLLQRWFIEEGHDKTLRVETMRMLQAVGKLKPLNEAVSTQSETEVSNG